MNENVLPELVDQGAFGGGLVDTWSHGKLVFGHMHKTQCKWQRIGAHVLISMAMPADKPPTSQHPPPAHLAPPKTEPLVLPQAPTNPPPLITTESGSITGCHCRACHMHSKKLRSELNFKHYKIFTRF